MHTQLRSLASRAFTPRRVSQLEVKIREICAQLLDPHVGGSGFDYVQDFAAQMRIFAEWCEDARVSSGK